MGAARRDQRQSKAEPEPEPEPEPLHWQVRLHERHGIQRELRAAAVERFGMQAVQLQALMAQRHGLGSVLRWR